MSEQLGKVLFCCLVRRGLRFNLQHASSTLTPCLGASRLVGPHRVVIFHRIIRFYDNYILLSALMAGLSIGALQFSEFHPTATTATQAAEGLLTSAACSAVFAVMLAVMLSFHFEGQDSATRFD